MQELQKHYIIIVMYVMESEELNLRILIVEDEVRLAEALGQIMEEAKYITDVVYDGNDGPAYALCG